LEPSEALSVLSTGGDAGLNDRIFPFDRFDDSAKKQAEAHGYSNLTRTRRENQNESVVFDQGGKTRNAKRH
jgi:hypothetical protein